MRKSVKKCASCVAPARLRDAGRDAAGGIVSRARLLLTWTLGRTCAKHDGRLHDGAQQRAGPRRGRAAQRKGGNEPRSDADGAHRDVAQSPQHSCVQRVQRARLGPRARDGREEALDSLLDAGHRGGQRVMGGAQTDATQQHGASRAGRRSAPSGAWRRGRAATGDGDCDGAVLYGGAASGLQGRMLRLLLRLGRGFRSTHDREALRRRAISRANVACRRAGAVRGAAPAALPSAAASAGALPPLMPLCCLLALAAWLASRGCAEAQALAAPRERSTPRVRAQQQEHSAPRLATTRDTAALLQAAGQCTLQVRARAVMSPISFFLFTTANASGLGRFRELHPLWFRRAFECLLMPFCSNSGNVRGKQQGHRFRSVRKKCALIDCG